jgi:hypothetical protein
LKVLVVCAPADKPADSHKTAVRTAATTRFIDGPSKKQLADSTAR